MAKKNPFKILPLDVESYLLSTAHMTNEAVGAYTRILFKGWIDLWPVGMFSNDDSELSEMAQSDAEEWQRVKQSVKRRFRPTPGGNKLRQDRLAKTFKEVQDKVDAASEKGRKGGKASAESRRRNKEPELNPGSTNDESGSSIEPNQTKLNGTELNRTKPNAAAGVREVLDWADVGGGKKKCLAVDGLTPLCVLIQAEKNKRGGGGPGALVDVLTSRSFIPMLGVDPETLVALCRRGRIASICGHEVRSDGSGSNVSYTNHGIVIANATGDVEIHERELFAERIEVRLNGDKRV